MVEYQLKLVEKKHPIVVIFLSKNEKEAVRSAIVF